MKLSRYRIVLLILLLHALVRGQSVLDNVINPGRLPFLKKSKLVQVSSHDRTGGNNDRINIHAGKTVEIMNMEGPGVITRIWVTIDSRDPHFLRRIVLRMYWDDETEPSVEAPVGDFFGTGFEYKHYLSAFTGMSSGGYFSYFAMPFNKSARIEVVNETGREIYAFYYQINVQKMNEQLPEDAAYFHAQWRRDLRTDPASNYTILEAKGRGHFVGLNMSMQSYTGGLFYLEGDEMVYVDGEKYPSVYGTGTEDYFTGGWYFKDGEFDGAYHGVILKHDSLARIAAYRYHVGDAIPFENSLRFTMEHGHGNTEICDYSSTAYWYQKEPHAPFPDFPKASLRIPLRMQVPSGGIEAEGLEVKSRSWKAEPTDMSDYGPEWSGLTELTVSPGKSGDTFTLKVPCGEELGYDIDLYYTKGPEYGYADIFSSGENKGEIDGFAEILQHGGKIKMKSLQPVNGFILLTFKARDVSFKSGPGRIGLDMFLLRPVREYIPAWNIIGPFPNERESDIERFGLDTVYPPEREIDLDGIYTGVYGQKIGWSRVKTPESGYFSLWNKFQPYELVVCYALTYVYSPRKQTVPLFIGTDDGSKVFLNGKELYRFLEVRISAPDQDKVDLHLKKGWNTLLLKIENNFGGYAFFARILDKERSLRFSTKLE